MFNCFFLRFLRFYCCVGFLDGSDVWWIGICGRFVSKDERWFRVVEVGGGFILVIVWYM